MIMGKKDAIKLFIGTSLTILLFFGIVIIVLFLSSNTMGVVIGGLLAFILICIIFHSVYPVVFKDYIDKFWKEEERKCREKEQRKNIQK